MKTFAASLLSLLCLASVSYAGQKAAKEDAPTTPALSFDKLRVACQNPAKFHNQIAPANIQVTCKDIQEKWVADPDGNLQMPTERDWLSLRLRWPRTRDSLSGLVKSPANTTTFCRDSEMHKGIWSSIQVTGLRVQAASTREAIIPITSLESLA